MARAILIGMLLALLGCGGDSLSGCQSCQCNCTGSTITSSVTGSYICNCTSYCAQSGQCGSSFVSATCIGFKSDVSSCVQ